MRFNLCFCAAALLAVFPLAYADTVYTSAAAYASATGVATTQTFNGIAGASSFVAETNPFTLAGLTYTFSAGSTAFVIGPNYYSGTYGGGGYLSVDYTTPTESLTVTLPSVTAVSFNFGGLLGATAPFVVTLSDGFTTTLSTATSITGTSSLAFAGLTSSAPLTSITFTLPDGPNYNALDNLSYAQAVTVTPEPSSFLLLGTGVLCAAGSLRRRFLA